MRCRVFPILLSLSVTLAFGHSQGLKESPEGILVLKDFLLEYGRSLDKTALESRVNRLARSDQVIRPAFSLHPNGEDDSVLSFPSVDVPQRVSHEEFYLLFYLGLSDGIRWDDSSHKPNGVRFSIVVDNEILMEEVVADLGWKPRAVPLTRWAGARASVEFRTNAIESNASYDWALFGEPILISLKPGPLSNLPEDTVGVAVAQVQCGEPSDVVLSMGDLSERASLNTGMTWIPLHFKKPGEAKLTVSKGSADLIAVKAAPHTSNVILREVCLGTPLVLAGTPFSIYAIVQNMGFGVYAGDATVHLEPSQGRRLEELGKEATQKRSVGRLGPGERKALVWPMVSAAKPGDWALKGTLGSQSEVTAFRVFSQEPAADGEHPQGNQVSATQGTILVATVGNAFARLRFIGEKEGPAYAVAETWNGKAWQRVGSLYPLARVIAVNDSGGREELRITIQSFEERGDKLVVTGQATPSSGEAWPLNIECLPMGKFPRLALRFELTAPKDGKLFAFYGPILLAGDKSFGAKKDFAVFPGLEFLEADEPSSSPRDLAPPLCYRSVPDPRKIAAPLMAVQKQGCLVGLLWDESQEWTSGEKFPACRFVCPKQDSGMDHIHMSLFAPSVGQYVPENHEEAATPFPVSKGQRLRLSCQILLDHESRYEEGSVVKGPHKAGLLLQSVQQWVEAFGLPEPSQEPRNWEQQRALCRKAYLNALWQENPPGWSPHLGAEPSADLELALPLLLDLSAGMPKETAQEIRRRIGLVQNLATMTLMGTGTSQSLLSSHRVFLPLVFGHFRESAAPFHDWAESMLSSRENGYWVWRPQDQEHRGLGIPGSHTLGQAAFPSLTTVRAGLCIGDRVLLAKALEAMRQMELYEIPRGASMWECPQLQPDLLAAALAIRAYSEAYEGTGDPQYLEHARYWAWTGLPFVYLWQMDRIPTMLYNTVGVMGSTYYTHSWLGRPVVWMGLDYAYALLDLAKWDSSFPWRTVAQGITRSAMAQQLVQGDEQGLYPDSWEMATNKPNPVFLAPLLIQLNEFKLRGVSLGPHHQRVVGEDGDVFLSAGAEISSLSGSVSEGRIHLELISAQRISPYASLGPVSRPKRIRGAGKEVQDSQALESADRGWMYCEDLKILIAKCGPEGEKKQIKVMWK